ncbi:MAG: glycerophosphodiester phosphodiesterase [Jatrophihabitantaceae bacterium]
MKHHTRAALPRCEQPLVFAHRGASYAVAEHTLPAYLSAIDNGADGLECDVRLTRDGHLVCVHDRTVNRTSNGSGIVSEYDLSALRELDFQSWRDDLPDSADQLRSDSPYLAGVAPDRLSPDSSRVLTLETLLSVVADADRPIRLLIETKHPTRYGGLVEQELVRLLQRFGWAAPTGSVGGEQSPVTIMSFAQVALRRVRLLAPTVPLVLLLLRETPFRRDGSLPTGVYTAGPGLKLLREEPGFVARAHAAGNRVFCWTVDEPADIELVSRLGIDAIITNRPREVQAQLGYLS